ncbi:MAG: two component transcriptional regulator, AraC family [Oscillospiraceae bacterium]|nr:two component transcriptional regulator, AraC family [Oscillospiraceae bacterium]
MHSAIIADDEDKICMLIQKLVDWETLDIRVVGVANNGNDAFQMIERYRPDIVITDIRMPGLDGIQLVEKTRKLDIAASFVVISGYRQFEYAHQALKFGVEDYLLKPIKKDELTATLQKICARKQSEAEHRKQAEGEPGMQPDQAPFNCVPLDGYFTSQRTNQLTRAVAALSLDFTQRMIGEAFAWVSMQPNVSSVTYFAAAERLASVIGAALVRGGMRAEPPGFQQIPGVTAAAGSDVLRKALMDWVKAEMTHDGLEYSRQEHLSIRQARQYIAEHFTEPLTLEEVAGFVHLNAYYFSAVFKREQGVNFNYYIMNLRIEAAKGLLRKSNLSVSQVAEQVGYRDIKYFRKIFLQEVGIKPSEYRRLYA